MPERLDLDTRLARTRDDLLDAIVPPALTDLRARAALVRRRRRGRVAAGALLAVLAAVMVVVRPWAGDGSPAPRPAEATPPGGPVYTAGSLVVNGLVSATAVTAIDGAIVGAEFVDADHGYVLAACAEPRPCPAVLARTGDGGLTWSVRRTLPPPVAGVTGAAVRGLRLIAFPEGRLVVAIGQRAFVSADGGDSWQEPPPAPAGPATLRPGEVLRAGRDGCGGAVEVWSDRYGLRGDLADQPDLTVCWVASTPTATGAWWVGGVADGQAALAVTRDGGGHWRSVPLGVPAGAVTSVQVSALGEHHYAVVLGAGREILAILHSADGGASFTRTRSATTAEPRTLAGAAVPLLDGRLLVTGTDQRWYVSADDGATFTRAEGTLPAAGPAARTPAGYVLYDLFSGGWAAFSADGSTWRKLQIN